MGQLKKASQEILTSDIADNILKCKTLSSAIREKKMDAINNCLEELCKLKSPSCLRSTNTEDLMNFDWNMILNEIHNRCPELLDIFLLICCRNYSSVNLQEQIIIRRIGMVYGILMQSRCKELSLVQRLMTVILTEGGVTKKCNERLQKVGVCLSYTRKINLLEKLGGHFNRKLVDAVRGGKSLRGTGDNLDYRELPHDMTSENQNKDLHYFATNFIVNRIEFPHLNNDVPDKNLEALNLGVFLPTIQELTIFRESAKVLVTRVLLEFLDYFRFAKNAVPDHIPHPYADEMSKKSTICSMPVLPFSENDYSHVVQIMRTYERWIGEIYQISDLVEENIHEKDMMNFTQLLDGRTKHPDQPQAHTLRDDLRDPLRGISVPFGGDQLTRVRFAGARDLVAGNTTATQRFDHTVPYTTELWHTKASFLQYSYANLYNNKSTREVGTLHFFKERYNRKNVDAEKVTKSYEGTEQLFISVGKAYIVAAAMEFWGIRDISGRATKNLPPSNIVDKTKEEKAKYLDEVVGKFVDQFVLHNPDEQIVAKYETLQYISKNAVCDHAYLKDQLSNALDNIEESRVQGTDDFIRNYGLQFIHLTVMLMQLKDTAAEGDGDRAAVNEKLLLSFFKANNNYSKYALEMLISIIQKEVLLSEKMAEKVKWGKFVNWKGGKGNNIENDLAQEISIKMAKDLIKGMGANKTLNAITMQTKAVSGILDIISNFDQCLNVQKSSSNHSRKGSKDDEIKMISDLQSIRPFMVIPGRNHPSFPDISANPRNNLNMREFHLWIKKHLKQLNKLEK
eukprot:gene16282-17920_t